MGFQLPSDQELDVLSLRIPVEPSLPFSKRVEARYPGKADRMELVNYF